MKQLRNTFIIAAIPHHYSSIFKTYSSSLIRWTTCVSYTSDNKILDTLEICGWGRARGGRTNSLDSSIIAREISSGTSHDRIFNAATFLPNNLTSRSTFNHEVFPLSPPFFYLSAIISLFQTSNDGGEWGGGEGKIAKKGGREHSSCLKEVQSDWRTNYREVYQSRTLLPFLPLPPPLTLSPSLSLLEPTLPTTFVVLAFFIY